MAVVGGGVAGTACAVALARIGARVTVYEAYEDPAGAVESFLSLAANGLRGLEVLGVLDQVRAAGFSVARQRMWAGNEKLLGDVPRGRTSDDPMISVTVMRAGLVAALRAEAGRAGVSIVTGRRLDGDGLAEVITEEADLVVGAEPAGTGPADSKPTVTDMHVLAQEIQRAYDPGTLAGVVAPANGAE